MNDEVGYLYAAHGKNKYYYEAVQSVKSLRKSVDSPKVALVCERDVKLKESTKKHFDRVIKIKKSNVRFKIRALGESPYSKTVFLDTDTYVLSDISKIFGLLGEHDVCIAQAPIDLESVYGIEAYTPYNTGVIGYTNSDKVNRLLNTWAEEYKSSGDKRDQASFMKAMMNMDISNYVLRNNWNARYIYFESYTGKVKILHGRLGEKEKIAKSINRTSNNRVWIPPLRYCIHRHMNINDISNLTVEIIKYLTRSIRRNY